MKTVKVFKLDEQLLNYHQALFDEVKKVSVTYRLSWLQIRYENSIKGS